MPRHGSWCAGVSIQGRFSIICCPPGLLTLPSCGGAYLPLNASLYAHLQATFAQSPMVPQALWLRAALQQGESPLFDASSMLEQKQLGLGCDESLAQLP